MQTKMAARFITHLTFVNKLWVCSIQGLSVDDQTDHAAAGASAHHDEYQHSTPVVGCKPASTVSLWPGSMFSNAPRSQDVECHSHSTTWPNDLLPHRSTRLGRYQRGIYRPRCRRRTPRPPPWLAAPS